MAASCTLSIMVARTDIPFMMHTIPHLVRMCNFPFVERVLTIDTAPLTGDKVGRPGIGTMEELRDRTQQLLAAGVVDRIVDIDYSPEYRERVYRQHFGGRIRQTHNYKGYPIWGTIFTIEDAKSDYFLHFDSDMMLHQQSGYSWIEEGMKLLQQQPEVMAVRPLTGPPTKDGTLQQRFPYQLDSKGFYSFKFFSSRVYLIDRKKFDQLLPLDVLWRPARTQFINSLPVKAQTVLNYAFKKGALDSWEVMVSKQFEKTDYVRATLASPQAWTLHPVNRGADFIQALPHIINKIEQGWYPPEQAGDYDLKFDLWQSVVV